MAAERYGWEPLVALVTGERVVTVALRCTCVFTPAAAVRTPEGVADPCPPDTALELLHMTQHLRY